MAVHSSLFVSQEFGQIRTNSIFTFVVIAEDQNIVYQNLSDDPISFSHLEWPQIKQFIEENISKRTHDDEPQSITALYQDKVNNISIGVYDGSVKFFSRYGSPMFVFYIQEWSLVSAFISKVVNEKNILREEKKLPAILRAPFCSDNLDF